MATSARPLLVAVMAVTAGMSADSWRRARGEIADYASEFGYGLLDVLELRGEPSADEATYLLLEGHASRSEAVAILSWTDLSDDRLQLIASRCGTEVLAPGPGRSQPVAAPKPADIHRLGHSEDALRQDT